jgi:hypothetical protein
VGIDRLRTTATEFSLVSYHLSFPVNLCICQNMCLIIGEAYLQNKLGKVRTA